MKYVPEILKYIDEIQDQRKKYCYSMKYYNVELPKEALRNVIINKKNLRFLWKKPKYLYRVEKRGKL